MKRMIWAAAVMVAFASPALAADGLIACDMQVTFHKPGIHQSEWVHQEGKYTKYFRIDTAAKTVSVYDARRDNFVPICAAANKACVAHWADGAISLDATAAPDAPVPPYLDFRRTFALSGGQAQFSIADYGDSLNGKPNMRWTFAGACHPAARTPPPLPYPPGPHGKNYVDATVFPISKAETDRALANRVGNTVTGFSSAGGAWFHMWMFKDGVAFTGDDNDISAEGAPRQWYFGKDTSGGYRLCEAPVTSAGETGCYPLLIKKIGDHWVEHDLYGDAEFELLPGRQ